MLDQANHDRLLNLLDRPEPDADAPRNPVLTNLVMERVRLAHANAHASARIAKTDNRPWVLCVLLVAIIALVATTTGMISDGGLGEAASLFDGEQVLELVIGAVVAAAALALSWRRLA